MCKLLKAKEMIHKGKMPGALFLKSCDLGVAIDDEDNIYTITWGRNLTEERIHESTSSFLKDQKFITKDGIHYEIIIPDNIGDKLLSLVE